MNIKLPVDFIIGLSKSKQYPIVNMLKKRGYKFLAHLSLILFILLLLLPLYLAVVAASHEANAMVSHPLPKWPGSLFYSNLKTILQQGITTDTQSIDKFLINSFISAFLIASGKVLVALFSAFALVYFKFPFKKCCYALIFSTMMLPLEVRLVPTFQVVAIFGWVNTMSGLTLPLMASATATFLFRQFFKTIPQWILDAAKMDGVGPIRFFIDFILPLSISQIVSLFIIMFVYGWNQYIWPLVILTDPSMSTIVMGLNNMIGVADQLPQWNYIMIVTLLALLPPCVLVLFCQRWVEKGLVE